MRRREFLGVMGGARILNDYMAERKGSAAHSDAEGPGAGIA